MARQSEHRYYNGTTWRNDVTGRSVSVPRGWICEEQQNDEKQPVRIFSGPDIGVYVVFAKEDVQPELTLAGYADAWIFAVNSTMHLFPPGHPTSVNGRSALRITGNVVDDLTQKG